MQASPDSSAAAGAAIGRRLDALPADAAMWRRVFLLSLGALFEIYDLFLTAYLSPGLVRAGIFRAEGTVLWFFSSQALFAAATFAGLWVGTLAFSAVADRCGRRPIFAFSLLWYTAATLGMGLQSTATGIYLWRFFAGIGIGVELVTVDAYISEWVPKAVRGRAFAFNAFVQFLGVPLAAFLAWWLVPRRPFGIDGWRWVAFASSAAAIAVWFARRHVPESPRWLAEHGRLPEAEAVLTELERTAPKAVTREPDAPSARRSAANAPLAGELRRRIAMLVIFQFFQSIGFYGFGNWLPTLLAANGAGIVRSLGYSFAIALAYPVGPLIGLAFADRAETKRQLVLAALAIAAFGLLFARQRTPAGIIVLGILVTFSNCVLSYAFHAYQTELFPTRVRARAIGFCYSFSRLSTIFSSFMIAFFLHRFGTRGVFAFIAASMLIVATVIGAFGPRTRGLSLEETAKEA